MKRFIVLFMIIGLVAGSVATAEAKKKKPKRTTRTVEGSYDSGPLIIAGTCAQSGAIGCVSLISAADEAFVTAEVTDAHGLPVGVSISANTDGEIGDDETYGSFCGKTDAPIAVPSGQDLHFWVGEASGVAGCQPGLATSGTVKATFSNLP